MLVGSALLVVLPSCGFQLRGAVDLPPEIHQLAIDDVTTTSQIAPELRIQLRRHDIKLLDNIEDLPEAKKIRRVLKGFYGVLKPMGLHLRLVFITGISKFSKVGVFSDLNNLVDLTLNRTFATAFGITKDELKNVAPRT